MIRVTFFIGNGFDINAGLDTRYTDFYKYYRDKCPDDYLANHIGEDNEFGSDMEEALGRYTAYVSPEEEEKFWKSEGNLEFELVNYLEMQMSRANLDSKQKEIALEMQRSLTEFYIDLAENHKNHIADIFSRAENIVCSFISFNYTDILDRCLEKFRELMPDNFMQYHNHKKTALLHSTDDIMHIHGTISRDMVLGVNDVAQIGNERFRKRNIYRKSLIKEEQNESLGNSKKSKASDIINDSTIICIFGMSIGKTDKMWWQSICRWLQSDAERRLVVYTLGSENDELTTKPDLRQKEDDIRMRLKQNADVYDDEWEQIEKQICVKIGARIFGFQVV